MIIPKEIQALERLKNTLLAEGYWQDVLEDVSIIENALNQYYKLLKEDDETTKKLKALEVIKNKNVSMECLKRAINGKGLCWYNNLCRFPTEKLTQKEYDLLKEVLL